MKCGTFDELVRIVRAVEVGEPVVFETIERDVGFSQRAVAKERGERDTESSADVAHAAIHDGARPGPEENVAAVRSVDISVERGEPGVFEFKNRTGNGLPLRKRSAQRVQLGGSIRQ